MRTLQQIINVLMLVLFLFAAVVQYNDDDVLRWMIIYLVAASCCVGAAVGKLKWWVPAFVAAFCVGWAAIYAARGAWSAPFGEMFAEWEMRTQQVVEVREMWGLGIIAAWMILLAASARPGTPSPR